MKYAPNWLRDAFTECYTRLQWQARFKELPPDKQFDILCRLEPRKVDVDSGVSVNLIIHGLAKKVQGLGSPVQVVDVTPAVTAPVPAALPEALPDPWNDPDAPPEHRRSRTEEGGMISSRDTRKEPVETVPEPLPPPYKGPVFRIINGEPVQVDERGVPFPEEQPTFYPLKGF